MRPPPLAARARRLALELRLRRCCRDEDGALLHVLASGGRVRRAAEIGTGAGVGAAWIAAALPPGVPLHTTEPDAVLAAAVTELFSGDPDVHVLRGDWRDALGPMAPFDLLFVGDASAREDVAAVVGLVAPGGLIVLDALDAAGEGPDPLRERWLGHPRLAAVVVGTGGSARTLVASVRG